MTNYEARMIPARREMTNAEARMTNPGAPGMVARSSFVIGHSGFIRHSGFVIRHSAACWPLPAIPQC
jgi:hypothetical protein